MLGNQPAGKHAELPETMLAEIEKLALTLATLGGAEIMAALGGMYKVRYKTLTDDDEARWRDPVSEIDENVEKLIRTRIASQFPSHDVIGEEMDERPSRHSDFIWAIDPIDGTTNFVNGFPLFASSVGVLFRGAPVAGAVWCSTGHKLTGGVYHARRGSRLKYNSEPIELRDNPLVRRYLAGVPTATAGEFPWESRKTGSAAIECAFTAAGLLRVSKFENPNLWDVAGGIPLVLASGGTVYTKSSEGWHAFGRFAGEFEATEAFDAGLWRRPILVGHPEDVVRYAALDD
jgi:myo-inositol-1(or 4)-monophosphatase